MSLFDRFRLLAIGTKLALIELFRGYILVAVILGVDMTIQENAAANAPRAWFSRILPDVLKYMPLILALVGLVFPFVVRARSTGSMDLLDGQAQRIWRGSPGVTTAF